MQDEKAVVTPQLHAIHMRPLGGEEWEVNDSMSRREVAEFMNVHYNTIRKWERQGKLTPVIVHRGKVRENHYRRTEVETLAEDRSSAYERMSTLLKRQSPVTLEQVRAVEENKAMARELEHLREEVTLLREERKRLLDALLSKP